jgi:hypothetical protein
MGQMQTHAPLQKWLFDHLVSLSEQRWRDYNTEYLGGFQVDR